jgi:hypothetical protein
MYPASGADFKKLYIYMASLNYIFDINDFETKADFNSFLTRVLDNLRKNSQDKPLLEAKIKNLNNLKVK